MATQAAIWLFLVDARRGRLLRCGLTQQGRCHIEERDSIENAWPGHEHHPSPPLWKHRRAAYGIEDEETAEELHRFARQIVGWLEHKMAEYKVDRLVVLASPRFLGALRSVRMGCLTARVNLRKGELIRFPLWALSRHPMIRGLVAVG